MSDAILPRASAGRRPLVVAAVALAAAGAAAGAWRLATGLGTATNLSDGYPWGLWIGFDLALVALSGGAFTVAALVHVLRLHEYRPVLRPALLTGLLGYLAVQAILLVDLGRPDRFWGFLVFHNFRSPLFEVSWCVLLYTVVLALELLPAAVEDRGFPHVARVLRALNVPIAVAGITLSFLHQSTLGTLFTAMPERLHPLWHTPLLPVLFLVSAVGSGLSVAILVSLVAGRAFARPVEGHVLAGLARMSVVVWAAYLGLEIGRVVAAGRLADALALDTRSVWWLVEVVPGAALPLSLFAIPRVRHSQAGLAAAALLAVAGTAVNRFDVTLTGQAVPPGAAYVPHWAEALIQLGVLAAAALAWRAAARRLPILPEG